MLEDVADILHGPLLKLARSQKHLVELEKSVQSYLLTKPYSLMTLGEPKLDRETHFIEENHPLPEEFGPLIGDAVHNLRSALDLLMFALVGTKTESPDKIHFPFARRAEALSDTIKNRQIHLAGAGVVAAIEALKPYPGGNKWLSGLHELDIIDKHRIIIPAISTAAMTGSEANALMPSLGFHPTQTLVMPYTTKFIYQLTGTRHARKANRANIRAGKYERADQPAFQLVFDEAGPFKLDPVLVVLNQIHNEVEFALCSIARAARRVPS